MNFCHHTARMAAARIGNGEDITEIDDVELENLVGVLEAEIQERAYRATKQPIMEELAQTFGDIFGSRSPF